MTIFPFFSFYYHDQTSTLLQSNISIATGIVIFSLFPSDLFFILVKLNLCSGAPLWILLDVACVCAWLLWRGWMWCSCGSSRCYAWRGLMIIFGEDSHSSDGNSRRRCCWMKKDLARRPASHYSFKAIFVCWPNRWRSKYEEGGRPIGILKCEHDHDRAIDFGCLMLFVFTSTHKRIKKRKKTDKEFSSSSSSSSSAFAHVNRTALSRQSLVHPSVAWGDLFDGFPLGYIEQLHKLSPKRKPQPNSHDVGLRKAYPRRGTYILSIDRSFDLSWNRRSD